MQIANVREEKERLVAFQTLGEAQQALAEFDAKYWQHERGVASICHTERHLLKTLSSGLVARSTFSSNPRYFHHPLKNLTLYAGKLSDTLIEHALRLANNCDAKIEPVLIQIARYDHASYLADRIGEWFLPCWKAGRERLGPKTRRREISLLHEEYYWPIFFLQLLGELNPFFAVCERLDHHESFDEEKRQAVLDAAADLMKYALIFGPLGDIEDEDFFWKPGSAANILKQFLAPFEEHLKGLYARFAR